MHTSQESREANIIHTECLHTYCFLAPARSLLECRVWIHKGQNYMLHFTCVSDVIKTPSLVWGTMINTLGHMDPVARTSGTEMYLRIWEGCV